MRQQFFSLKYEERQTNKKLYREVIENIWWMSFPVLQSKRQHSITISEFASVDFRLDKAQEIKKLRSTFPFSRAIHGNKLDSYAINLILIQPAKRNIITIIFNFNNRIS